MLRGELNTRDTLNGILTGGVFYGTMDYEELNNKPSINSVELIGNKTLEDLGIIIPTATSDLTNDSGFITGADVPTKTSDLTNDSGFITSADVPTKTSDLVNDSGFVESSSLSTVATTGNYNDLTDQPTIPNLTSQLLNDSGYITSADIPTDVSAFTNDAGYITSADIPTDVSAFTNDAGYITSADIPTDVSAFTNDAGYISNSDLMTATASGSIATFDNGGDDIPVSEFECDIVAQQASGTPTPTSPLPITGHSESDIVVCGKNFFNKATIVNNKVWTGGGEQSASGFFHSDFIKVKPNTTYYSNSNGAGSYYTIYFFDSSKTLLGRADVGSPSAFTTTADTVWLIMNNNPSNTPLDELQLTEGNTAQAYEPYTGNLYTVAFGQTIYGGRLIYANGQWSIEATHEYISDLGALSWGYGGGFFYYAMPDLLNSGNAICSVYPCNTRAFTQMPDKSLTTNKEGFSVNNHIIVKDSTYTDLPTFQTAMTGQSLVYELATPVIIPITSSTRVKTISGDNNIYSNTGDCEVKYFTNKADSLAELIKAFVL